jgi:hypothetical protein
MRISIILMLIQIRIRIWIGINMTVQIRIGIKTMLIHNTVLEKQLKFLKRDFQKTMYIDSDSKS